MYFFRKNSTPVVYIILALISISLASCEKEIDLEVAQATPKIVVEALVSDASDSYVRITRSKSIYDNENTGFEAINDAEVKISDDQGNSFTFVNNSNGYYRPPSFVSFQGIAGRTYNLDIVADGKHITGVETMLTPVALEAVTFQNHPVSGTEFKRVSCHFQDPETSENYYLFKIIDSNPGLYNTLRSDLLFNGQHTEVVMDRYRGSIGDTIHVQLLHINKEHYKYFSTLKSIGDQLGPFGGGTPGNPNNTIKGDAIGFFCAAAINEISIVIP